MSKVIVAEGVKYAPTNRMRRLCCRTMKFWLKGDVVLYQKADDKEPSESARYRTREQLQFALDTGDLVVAES